MAGVIATVDAGNGATVEKDAKIATIYPNNAMQIKMVISEADLMDVTVGGKAEIEFNWDADSGRRFEGTISSISYLSEKKDDSAASQSAQYVAYVDFTPDETVRHRHDRDCVCGVTNSFRFASLNTSLKEGGRGSAIPRLPLRGSCQPKAD